ncbi:hypothetical protein T265_03982 [Opisthorchis viverrini]|uniref:Ig-like domain-containing protein n=1 Tax=Opisthorchis viverrini TaxID=6198 RepID=A0A075AH69_OPIVI|nr:hypothetical protein T265_03982 [Opisthorchis viverrini]KER29414.1 hypothetical protein T265_03982 [Opisthorchis viverrini]
MASILSVLLTVTTIVFGHSRVTVSACMQLTENERPVLFCQSSVPQLPLDSQQIPPDLAKVRILGISQSGTPHNGHLTAFNLTGLETLTYLEISNFNLVQIHPDTFKAMRQLRVLDLSRNRITMIQPGAFSGLHLNLLALTDNSGLVLGRGAFRGSEVNNLAARNCKLQDVDYETIAEAKPKQLGLSHNQITWLDPRFERLIRPWTSSTESSPVNLDDWGSIDLTDNPLSCNCQLFWLSRLLEEQLYAHQHETTNKIDNRAKVKPDPITTTIERPSTSGTKRMYQLNLTCGSPPELLGKPLPQSWRLYCPNPKIVGIDISLLTNQADHAQLTCIGQGQPAPSLAWTYRINGHKLQKTLDAVTQYTPNQSPSHYPHSEHRMYGTAETPNPTRLFERSIALNVSLKEPVAKNFTCTVWNDDSPRTRSPGHVFDAIDRLGSNGMQVPSQDIGEVMSNLRVHEVVVRIHGPSKFSPITVIDPYTVQDTSVAATVHNRSTSELIPVAAESTLGVSTTAGAYEYLFTERFSLLQLLGAVFGTFIVTLALLYSVTHFLHCFCQFPQFPVKDFHRSSQDSKTKKGWFNLSTNKEAVTLLNSGHSHTVAERSILHDTNFSKTLNCDSAFSLLTSGTNGLSTTPGPSTIPVRRHPIPQALLLTNVPAPPVDRNSVTPPPNPAYWPMPEYTYSGTGSHEYDVPRPLEPLVGNASLLRPTVPNGATAFQGAAQSFLSLSVPSTVNGSDSIVKHNPVVMQPTDTLSTMHNPWLPNIHPGSALNSIFSWGQAGGTGTVGLQAVQERQLPSVSYTQYPSSQSIVYTGDYPTYLQTRPYPHHQQQIQPLLEMMTNSHRFSGVAGRSVDHGTSRNFAQTQETFPTSESHTAETNSSRTGSTS